MTVTRTRLDRCSTKGCPWPLDEDAHRPWCLSIPGVQHTRDAQHQHWPKRSQGGKTIAAILCAYCHSRVDNTPHWDNKVLEFDDGERVYRLWDTKTGEILIDRVIEEGRNDGEVDTRRMAGASNERTSRSERAAVVEADMEGRKDGADSVRGGSDNDADSPVGASTAEGEDAGGTRPTRETDSVALPSAAGASIQEDTGAPAGSNPIPQDTSRKSEGVARSTPFLATTPASVPSIAESLKPNGLDLPEEYTFQEWTDLAGMVAGMNKNRQWWAGDLMLAGERFGERATQLWNDMGYKYESLANCIRVCRRFPRPLRNEGRQFSHHAVVHSLGDKEAWEWLAKANDHDWTVKQLREAVFGKKPRAARWTLDDLHKLGSQWPDRAVGCHRGILMADVIGKFFMWIEGKESDANTS